MRGKKKRKEIDLSLETTKLYQTGVLSLFMLPHDAKKAAAGGVKHARHAQMRACTQRYVPHRYI